MTKRVKQSVALALFDEFGRLLAVQRPEDDEDLPDAWGLPASTLRAGESWEEEDLDARYPRLLRYLARLIERPAFQRAQA